MTTRLFLLTGHPGVGKTTLVRRIVERWQGPVGGFYTEEIRQGSQRQGFKIITLDGREDILARVGLPSRHRLGRYGIDVDAVERTAVPAVYQALEKGGLVVIDEVGKMELLSPAFIEALHAVVDSRQPLLATLLLGYHPEVDKLMEHPEAHVWQVTINNRNHLVHQLLALLKQAVQQPSPSS